MLTGTGGLGEHDDANGDDETKPDRDDWRDAVEEGLEVIKRERHDTHLELGTPGERGLYYLNNAKIGHF
jgi:hypothetical protein